VNPQSLEIVTAAALEPALAEAEPEEKFQFERLGYFSVDAQRSEPGRPSFNRTVTLRDSWAKIEQQALAAESDRSAAEA
jgi:glutaminyl-tRNA synthetase